MAAPNPLPDHVYKILPNTSIYQGIPKPVPSSYEFPGTALDAQDGLVHLSTVTQLGSVLNRFFVGKEDETIQLIKIDFKRLKAWKIVKWEKASDGESYPHLFATLEGEYVRDWRLVSRGKEGWRMRWGSWWSRVGWEKLEGNSGLPIQWQSHGNWNSLRKTHCIHRVKTMFRLD